MCTTITLSFVIFSEDDVDYILKIGLDEKEKFGMRRILHVVQTLIKIIMINNKNDNVWKVFLLSNTHD